MEIRVAERQVDRGQPLEVMADDQLVGHAHAAVQLNRLLADEAARLTDRHLGCRQRAPTLARIRGMFAIAVWDTRDRTLSLARDRLGEKPLFYGWSQRGSGPVFLFGSELKAIRAHPDFEPSIDRQALMRLGSQKLRSGVAVVSM